VIESETGARRRRWRRSALVTGAVALVPLLLLATAVAWLTAAGSGTASPAARSTGSDAIWLGHAWVDGRHTQSDMDALAARLRTTGVHDVFVHSGPLSDDGTLDPALRPRARWLITALHQALSGVRVQSWLGDVAGPGRLDLDDPETRDHVLASAGQVLDDGFDGVHYDLEPVADDSPGLLTLLAATHALTRQRRAVLSVAADQIEPLPGLAGPGQWVTHRPHWWSAGYLGEIAQRVDEVAIMAYDSGVPFDTAFSGYVRIQTRLALDAVPPAVTLLIGVPAYHTVEPGHTDAETVAASVRGVRLALGGRPSRPFGVAIYADFSATGTDWHDYLTGWVAP
jgi:hypothetical protein